MLKVECSDIHHPSSNQCSIQYTHTNLNMLGDDMDDSYSFFMPIRQAADTNLVLQTACFVGYPAYVEACNIHARQNKHLETRANR